jgi:hypothetical protein
MVLPEHQEQFEAHTREQFEALGRFVQAFEHVVFAIRSVLSSRLQQESPNMVFFTRMFLNHKSLTAGPLWEMFRAMVYTDVSELRPVDPSDANKFHDALSKIGKELEAIISARNNIIHGTPFIGWVSSEQDDFSKMDILKSTVSAKGYKVSDTPKSAADLNALAERCKGAENAVRVIGFAAALPEPINRARMLDRVLREIQGIREFP